MYLKADNLFINETRLRLACLALASTLGIAILLRVLRVVRENDYPRFHVPQPNNRRLRERQRAGIDLLINARGAVVSFVEMIVSPERYRPRVVETIDFEARIIRQSVSVEFLTPDIARIEPPRTALGKAEAGGPAVSVGLRDKFLYIPILQPFKGELVDNFQLRDAGGTSVVDLTNEETIRLAAAGLRFLVREAVRSAGGMLDDNIDAQEFLLLSLIARRGREGPRPRISANSGKRIGSARPFARSGKEISGHGPVEQLVTEIVKTNLGLTETTPERRRLERYVRALSNSYPIVAVVDRERLLDRRILMKYARSRIPTATRRSFVGFVRMIFGLQPDEVHLYTDLALTAGSYHLRINGPISTYVRDQALRCHHCRKRVTRMWRATVIAPDPKRWPNCHHEAVAEPKRGRLVVPPASDSDIHFRSRRGQSFVHLYMRERTRGQARLKDLEVWVRFKEAPPGSRALALVTGTFATFLIWMVGYLTSAGQGVGALTPTIAFLLTLPGVVATWFGFRQDGDTLASFSLLARLSLVATGGLSLLSAMLVLYGRPLRFLSGVGVLGIRDPRWAGLFILSFINTIYILYRFILKVAQYNWFLRKGFS
jgi:hypothetical protein